MKKKKGRLGRVASRPPAKRSHRGANPLPASNKPKMKFYEETHKYVDNGVEYTPVTYFLKTFKPWVNWDEKAAKKAEKLGIPKEELLKQWADARNKGASAGTRFHKVMEEKYQASPDVIVADTKCTICYTPLNNGIRDDSKMILDDNTVYTEKIIWSRIYKISGTADLVEVVNGTINIRDYKTNKVLKFEAWKHPLTGPEKLKFPIGHLDNCDWSIYQLQINTYMYMLLRANRNLKMGDMEILHAIPKEDGSFAMIPYKVKNMQKEVQNMLEVFKARKK